MVGEASLTQTVDERGLGVEAHELGVWIDLRWRWKGRKHDENEDVQ